MHAHRYSRGFTKRYRKLDSRMKAKANRSIQLLLEDQNNQLLNLHPLYGDFLGYWSINVTGDYRIIFWHDADMIVFERIGTHSQLYG